MSGNNLDLAVPLQKKDFDIFKEVDEVIQRSLEVGTPDAALNFGATMIRQAKIQGLGLAKLLARLRSNWEEFGVDDTYVNVVVEYMGYSKQTANKYANLWDAFEQAQISESTRKQIMSHSMTVLLTLTAAMREGDLEEDDYNRIAIAANGAEVKEIIQEKRGTRTSSANALTIFIDDDGILSCRKGGKGKFTQLGYLNLEVNSEIGQQAINRIQNSAGIVVK